jgi:hypothetical protein
MCWILFSADRDQEAWARLEVSLLMAVQAGNRGEVAKALEYMGYGNLRRGDYGMHMTLMRRRRLSIASWARRGLRRGVGIIWQGVRGSGRRMVWLLGFGGHI